MGLYGTRLRLLYPSFDTSFGDTLAGNCTRSSIASCTFVTSSLLPRLVRRKHVRASADLGRIPCAHAVAPSLVRVEQGRREGSPAVAFVAVL